MIVDCAFERVNADVYNIEKGRATSKLGDLERIDGIKNSSFLNTYCCLDSLSMLTLAIFFFEFKLRFTHLPLFLLKRNKNDEMRCDHRRRKGIWMLRIVLVDTVSLQKMSSVLANTDCDCNIKQCELYLFHVLASAYYEGSLLHTD
jgi:hypothetical protein